MRRRRVRGMAGSSYGRAWESWVRGGICSVVNPNRKVHQTLDRTPSAICLYQIFPFIALGGPLSAHPVSIVVPL